MEKPLEKPIDPANAIPKKQSYLTVREQLNEIQESLTANNAVKETLDSDYQLRTMRIEHALADLQAYFELSMWFNVASLVVLVMVLIRTYGLI
jgi:hypothetical protein